MVRDVEPKAVSSNASAVTVSVAAETWSVMSDVEALVAPINTTGFERYVLVAMIAP